MFREAILQTTAWLRRAVTQPMQELNRWQLAARFAYDLGRYGARQLRADRAPQMAAALAFRTLFGLAPVLVVAMVLVKYFSGTDAILGALHELFVAVGLDEIRILPASGSEGAGLSSVTLAQWLENLTGQLASTNLSAIGWAGFAVIVYAAIGLMVTIENGFNIIFRAAEGRPWTRRVPLYWFLLTVGPAMISLGNLVNGQFTGWIESVDTWQWLLLTVQFLWSFGIAWLFVFAVYSLVPNTKVETRPALIGALVTTLLLGLGKHTLGASMGSTFAINQLYGSLGLVPLFMFWVYLMWLVVLFGLQVSAILQRLRGRTLEEMDPPRHWSAPVDPMSVLTVAEVLGERFIAGRPMTTTDISQATAIPEATVMGITQRLLQEGWLHRVEAPEGALTLAKPMEQMPVGQLLALGHRMADEQNQGRRSALADQLRAAQQEVAQQATLDMLIPKQAPSA